MRASFPMLALTSATLLAVGCTTYRDELVRVQNAYDANEHETALALERAIEPNAALLTTAERTRYYYLVLIFDDWIAHRGKAPHFLSISKAMETQNPGALPTDWKNRLEETLSALNTEVYSNGISALSAHEAEAKKAKKK